MSKQSSCLGRGRAIAELPNDDNARTAFPESFVFIRLIAIEYLAYTGASSDDLEVGPPRDLNLKARPSGHEIRNG